MTCQDCRELLSAYADGELTLDRSQEPEQHIDACGACRSRFESMRALKHGIARLPGREMPPAAVQARIDAARLELLHARRNHRLVIAAAVALIIAGVSVGYLYDRRADVTGVLVADHYRSLPDVTPPHLASGDPVVVGRHFEGKTAFRPFVPTFHEATLVGARLCRINGRNAELLFYDASGTTVSLFICPVDAVSISPGCRSRSGATVCSGTKNGVSIHAVGTLPRGQLERLVAEATSL